MAEDDVINSSWAAPEQWCSRQHGCGADYTLRILSSIWQLPDVKRNRAANICPLFSVEKGDARSDIVTRQVGRPMSLTVRVREKVTA